MPYIPTPSRRPWLATWRVALLVASAIVLLPLPAAAQYFGRNKVQYETFDWRVLHTEHFAIHYYPAESLATTDAARMAERAYTRLSVLLDHEFGSKPVVFYANHPDFQQTNTTGGFIDIGTGGFTEPIKNRVVMPFTGIYRETDHVLTHELVHAFQFDIASRTGGGSGLRLMSTLPLWLIEGMAEYLSQGRADVHTAMWMRDAVLRDDMPTLRELSSGRYFPYRFGQAFWAYLGGRYGDDIVRPLYKAAVRYGWESAIRRVLRTTSDSLSLHWHQTVKEAYLPLLATRTAPTEVGETVLGERQRYGDMNVAPVVSPDGRHVAFFSGRGLFSVDLFLADLRTGEIIEQFGTPNVEPHFDALSFINSAGAWSPDGKLFAVVVFAEGDNALVIYDVSRREIVRRIRVRGVGEMRDPAWSPDGSTIAFSGTTGGISDLYLLDYSSGAVRQITYGLHAEIQPAWSPDGSTLVFATDRGPGTEFAVLSYAEMRLAAIDVVSREMRMLPSLGAVKHINPQFSPDGRSVFFISDQGGYSDIYRLELATGNFTQITRIATGVSGITALSPAMSVAKQDGRMVFSVFIKGGYQLRQLDPGQLEGQPVAPRLGDVAYAGVLPPLQPVGNTFVSEYLHNPRYGLEPTESFRYTDYDPDLGLEYLGTPTVGVAVNRFGAGIAGGIASYFTDLLRDRVVGATIQANGSFKDIGGELFYMGLEGRWDWVVGAMHVPFVSGGTAIFDTTVTDGTNTFPARAVEQVIQRVYLDQGSLMAQYPLSRTRRWEFTAGYQRYSFDYDVEIFVFDPFGQPLDRAERDPPAPDALNFFSGAVAFVGDYSNFGFTSPVAGGRYRFEVSPTFGSLTYQTVLADYRRYLFFNPVTLAMRGLHYGRYGKDSESGRQRSLFVGYETFVRGYAIESFDPSECTGIETRQQCPELERLLGSKLAVANLELRIPLLGTDQLGLISAPFLPTEVAPFVDAGLAWRGDDRPAFRFDRNTEERVPVFSAGLATRFNVFGALIFEAYYAYPFQRPEKGGHWGFQIASGW